MMADNAQHRFTSIRFINFKALRDYSVSLREFNVLVGPNNCGKSTVLSAFRILSEGIRKANSKSAELLQVSDKTLWGYRVPLDDLPIATENVFSDYDESIPATIQFRISNGNYLRLIFPESNSCVLICESTSRGVRTPGDFKREFPVSIGFVPILGPVEHDEPLFLLDAARRALLSHRASRNFRNIWYHYPEQFDEFRNQILSTWPGMDIEPPELDRRESRTFLRMFCPENRYPREIFWAGFGFQVWCQMLTYILRSKEMALLIIDEPDIYLHSDLQRQLVSILKSLGPDVLIATHSTEIICEAEPTDLLIVNKEMKAARRVKEIAQLHSVFSELGSSLNPVLTQLAKSHRVIFVEGKDFHILALFARILGYRDLANRSDFALVTIEGFNPKRVKELAQGMAITLGCAIQKAVILDRDYRSTDEVTEIGGELSEFSQLVHIHKRKEIENYLLNLNCVQIAATTKWQNRKKRGFPTSNRPPDIPQIFADLSARIKHEVLGQFIAHRTKFEKDKNPKYSNATIMTNLVSHFDSVWSTTEGKIELIPGKEMISHINRQLQTSHNLSVTATDISRTMSADDIPTEMKNLLLELEKFRLQTSSA